MNPPKLGPHQTQFSVDDKVVWHLGHMEGTGTVVGVAFRQILDTYIVLLDEPVQGQKALLVLSSQMKAVN